MSTGLLGFGGHGYDTRAPERPIQVGDVLVSKGERLVITHASDTADGRLVFVCIAPDGREVVRLGAAPGKPAEWDWHSIPGTAVA